MSNSSLATVVLLASPSNYTAQRNQEISLFTPHCVAGNLSVESTLGLFQTPSRGASCNYAAGSDGRIGLGLDEKSRAWTTSSGVNDNRAITVEVANSTNVQSEPWPMTDAAVEATIKLGVDVCQRNDMPGLIFGGDKSNSTMSAHRWFANKSCPGNFFYGKEAETVKEINRRLGITNPRVRISTGDQTDSMQGAFRSKYIKEMQTMLIKLGFSCGSGGADGAWGSGTDVAVKAFQAKYPNTKVAGYTSKLTCGRTMWEKLDDLCGQTPAPAPVPVPTPTNTFKVGDIVEFLGGMHYGSANATAGTKVSAGKAKVTQTYNGAHPYHVVSENTQVSSVYGWVDANTLKAIEQKSTAQITVDNGVADNIITSPEYWVNVIEGKTVASGDNIKALIDKYHAALSNK